MWPTTTEFGWVDHGTFLHVFTLTHVLLTLISVNNDYHFNVNKPRRDLPPIIPACWSLTTKHSRRSICSSRDAYNISVWPVCLYIAGQTTEGLYWLFPCSSRPCPSGGPETRIIFSLRCHTQFEFPDEHYLAETRMMGTGQWRFYVGARGHRLPKSCPPQKKNSG